MGRDEFLCGLSDALGGASVRVTLDFVEFYKRRYGACTLLADGPYMYIWKHHTPREWKSLRQEFEGE